MNKHLNKQENTNLPKHISYSLNNLPILHQYHIQIQQWNKLSQCLYSIKFHRSLIRMEPNKLQIIIEDEIHML